VTRDFNVASSCEWGCGWGDGVRRDWRAHDAPNDLQRLWEGESPRVQGKSNGDRWQKCLERGWKEGTSERQRVAWLCHLRRSGRKGCCPICFVGVSSEIPWRLCRGCRGQLRTHACDHSQWNFRPTGAMRVFLHPLMMRQLVNWKKGFGSAADDRRANLTG